MKLNNDNHASPDCELQSQPVISSSLSVNYLSPENIVLPPILSNEDLLDVLGFPIRLENALKKVGKINTVGEFCNTPSEKLLKIRNIGEKSVSYMILVKQLITQRLSLQQSQEFIGNEIDSKLEADSIPKNHLIDILLERCGNERTKQVVIRRYGLKSGERETLEEIGESYALTRERIRQIQVKALNKMKHPITAARKPLIAVIEEVLFTNGGILSNEEADKEIPTVFGRLNDGSSILDLLCDLGWIQRCVLGDIVVYAPRLDGISLCKLIDGILVMIKEEDFGLDVHSITKKLYLLKKIKDSRFSPNDFILRYCRIDPRIEEFKLTSVPETVFRHYTSGHFATKSWVALMTRILEEEQTPLHFTEIANKVNDLIIDSDRKLDVRRAHSIMIESQAFAHSGIHGTYGLTSWGLRKESTLTLVEECLNKAGFPLHWKQIFNYVSKYKDSKPASIVSLLETRDKFKRVQAGTFWFNK